MELKCLKSGGSLISSILGSAIDVAVSCSFGLPGLSTTLVVPLVGFDLGSAAALALTALEGGFEVVLEGVEVLFAGLVFEETVGVFLTGGVTVPESLAGFEGVGVDSALVEAGFEAVESAFEVAGFEALAGAVLDGGFEGGLVFLGAFGSALGFGLFGFKISFSLEDISFAIDTG